MKIEINYPPNIEKIKERFDLGNRSVVFTYGDTLYNPSGVTIPDHLIVHEQTHTKQQVDPVAWWDRYLKDDAFRLSQELEAYRNQYQFVKGTVNNKNIAFSFLLSVAKDLSSELYGNIISMNEAVKKIENL